MKVKIINEYEITDKLPEKITNEIIIGRLIEPARLVSWGINQGYEYEVKLIKSYVYED